MNAVGSRISATAGSLTDIPSLSLAHSPPTLKCPFTGLIAPACDQYA